MSSYHIYHVLSFTVKPGKSVEASLWWKENGQRAYEQLPGVKSVRGYATQWALGGSWAIEIWVEIENYAAYDAWDREFEANGEKYADLFRMTRELFESGPSKVMGDWPESALGPSSST